MAASAEPQLSTPSAPRIHSMMHIAWKAPEVVMRGVNLTPRSKHTVRRRPLFARLSARATVRTGGKTAGKFFSFG
jgi:hypothetical protein